MKSYERFLIEAKEFLLSNLTFSTTTGYKLISVANFLVNMAFSEVSKKMIYFLSLMIPVTGIQSTNVDS